MKRYEIASLINRSPSTISREIKKNIVYKDIVRYRAIYAQRGADYRKKFKDKRQRIPDKRLRRFICKNLKKGYSPEIIVFLALKKNNKWKTNHETIYQWIYSDRHDLIPFLTRSHKKRRKRGNATQKRCPKVPNRVMIEKRPDYVKLRSRVGHWETDTIISRQSKAAVMVLAERRSRYVIIKKLEVKTAYCMHKSIVASLEGFHEKLKKSLTYDNGTENALHELTNEVLGMKSFFCNPYHSWEKGTVENLIGIVRRFYPKKTDWKTITQWDLNTVAKFINNRPMKCLGYKSPLQALVALAA
jgi:IS30 family transposase